MNRKRFFSFFLTLIVMISGCSFVQSEEGQTHATLEDMITTLGLDQTTTIVWDDQNPEASKEELNEAIVRFEEQVCVKGHEISWRDIKEDVFWLDSIHLREFSGLMKDSGDVCIVSFQYRYPQEEVRSMQTELNQEAEDIIAQIPQDSDTWTKIKIIHDELIRRTTYVQDEADWHIRDIYGTLVRKNAVCMGYAYAFDYLCSLVGITSETIESDTHAWNRISGIGPECYIDVTWDDSDEVDDEGNPLISYPCFLLNEEEMSRMEEHQMTEEFAAEEFAVTGDATEPMNYYKHEGYYLSSLDAAQVEEVLWRQINQGEKLLTLRFENTEDYQTILTWFESENPVFSTQILPNLGIQGEYWYWFKNEVQIVFIKI